MIQARTKILSNNCHFTIDNNCQNILQLAQEEARQIFKDNDCKLIYTYLLIKSVLKDLKSKNYHLPCNALSQITLKNDYAKQLYKEIREQAKQ